LREGGRLPADDLFILVLTKPGDHLVRQMQLATVSSAVPFGDETARRILGAFLFGKARTPAQDVRYHFQQLTDVVVRALSPGINDPFTAINGIDTLASGLALLARSSRIEEQRRDDQGTPRLYVPVPKLQNILKATVGHIAIYAKDDPFVMAKLWEVLDIVESELTDPEEQRAYDSLILDMRSKERYAKAE
jgi:uncharacterized membrane protein